MCFVGTDIGDFQQGVVVGHQETEQLIPTSNGALGVSQVNDFLQAPHGWEQVHRLCLDDKGRLVHWRRGGGPPKRTSSAPENR